MQNDETLLTFTYGSNMSSAYLRGYCPDAEPVMRAMLPNMQVQFRRYSDDLKGGISSIMPAPGDRVHGVLYRIPRANLEALDILEDVDKGLYLRETYIVLGADQAWHLSDLYRVANPTGPFKPSAQYLDFMRNGAEEHGLPAGYLPALIRRAEAQAADA